MGALLAFKGVSFPTASVILHFCVSSQYPILDVRAMWSLGIEKPGPYTIDHWRSYGRRPGALLPVCPKACLSRLKARATRQVRARGRCLRCRASEFLFPERPPGGRASCVLEVAV